MESESEIIELQTRLAFQEGTIQELSDIIARQQRALDELQKDVDELQRQLRTLMPADIAGEDEAPPPHY